MRKYPGSAFLEIFSETFEFPESIAFKKLSPTFFDELILSVFLEKFSCNVRYVDPPLMTTDLHLEKWSSYNGQSNKIILWGRFVYPNTPIEEIEAKSKFRNIETHILGSPPCYPNIIILDNLKGILKATHLKANHHGNRIVDIDLSQVSLDNMDLIFFQDLWGNGRVRGS